MNIFQSLYIIVFNCLRNTKFNGGCVLFHVFLLADTIYFPLLISPFSSQNTLTIAEGQTTRPLNNRNKRRRAPPNQAIINDDRYINLESSNSLLVITSLLHAESDNVHSPFSFLYLKILCCSPLCWYCINYLMHFRLGTGQVTLES